MALLGLRFRTGTLAAWLVAGLSMSASMAAEQVAEHDVKAAYLYNFTRFVEWPAAAVLAASLVLGVMLGTTGTVGAAMQEVAQVAGFGNGTSDGAQLALGDDALGQIDEDLL